jgi:putative ABC transport system permease protein
VRDASDLFYAPKDLVLRTGGDPLPVVPAIRRIVARADPQQPIANVQLLSDIVEAQTASRVLQVRVLSAFAAIAFVLAAVGIHGVLAYTVSQRIREIGVRIALGARSIDILMMILRQGVSMASAGIGLGVVLAYAIGRTVESLLAGIQPSDVSAFGSALGLAIVMTVAGSCWPVLRAVRVDPLVAIRVE